MELSFKVQVNGTKEAIWDYYADFSKRKIWEEDLEDLQLEGPLAAGTKGVMKLKDMPAMAFELTKVEKHVSFCDKTVVPNMGTLCFDHDIIEEAGQLFVRHTVRLEKADLSAQDLGFLQGVFSDVPHSVLKIKEEVEG